MQSIRQLRSERDAEEAARSMGEAQNAELQRKLESLMGQLVAQDAAKSKSEAQNARLRGDLEDLQLAVEEFEDEVQQQDPSFKAETAEEREELMANATASGERESIDVEKRVALSLIKDYVLQSLEGQGFGADGPREKAAAETANLQAEVESLRSQIDVVTTWSEAQLLAATQVAQRTSLPSSEDLQAVADRATASAK